MKLSTGMRASMEHALAKGLTFACFRRPGAPATLWAQRTPELENVDKLYLFELNDVFLVAPFDLDQEHLSFVRSDVELVEGDREPDPALLAPCEGSPLVAHPMQGASSEAAFTLGVERIKQRIMAGALQKTVLSRVLQAPLPTDRYVDLFEAALLAHPDAFVALVHTPDHGTWFGASPERLLHAEEDRVRVDALAGTRRLDQQTEPWGEKEQHEQELVTTEVLNTFVHLHLQEVLLHGPETLTAGGIQHLRSTVQADLGEVQLADVLVALHPTPAVCGVPRQAAREIIRTLEVHDRGLYTGFWGVWSADGSTDLYVNLRCMQLFEDQALLYVGAGITAGSDANNEWTETAQKARTMLSLIESLEHAPVSSSPR
jgi:isochorismate synthase